MRQLLCSGLSKLFKNVPSVTSFEMSPCRGVFLGIALFLFRVAVCGRSGALAISRQASFLPRYAISILPSCHWQTTTLPFAGA
ncbi:MAG: hypothetical protein LAN18_06780 [Acidobacteriia bacterium]|nr:hypothetical protein [Terriglobia bacterium]